MRGPSLITCLLFSAVTLCTLGIPTPKAIGQEPARPPTFGCEAGPGQECSYVIGDEHGNCRLPPNARHEY
jgi:hypothetical protein